MDNKSISVLKGLSLDIIQNSKGGNFDVDLNLAPIIYTLFTRHLKVNPANPNWINRDRFIYSIGDGSELVYAMMFLSGYQITIEDLKNYRKLNSKTPAYLDIKTVGVDANVGIPSEGFATSVGIALAEKIYENKYNKKPKSKFSKKVFPLIDYYTYVVVSDRELMEGISYEAASFAGNMNLDKLIVLYNHNEVTLDGDTNKTLSESVLSRFSSFGFDVQTVKNSNSVKDIDKAIEKAKKTKTPSIIQINSKKHDPVVDADVKKLYSGELTKDELQVLKQKIKIDGMPFMVDKEAAENVRNSVYNRGTKLYDYWEKICNDYKSTMNNDQILEFENINFNNLYLDLSKIDIKYDNDIKESLRDSNNKVMNIISTNFYNFLGGSADNVSSTKTYLSGKDDLSKTNYLGKNIYYGLRENAMGAISNGLALSGFRPFASTYLTSSDYMIPSIRMSALMNLPVTYIFTHDSITTGNMGPTYQPVEQLAHLRAMPNLNVYRPADIKEIIGCWQCILKDKTPSVITLAKTEVKPQDGTNSLSVSKGAYIVSDSSKVDAVIIATGAEVQLANSVKERLKPSGIGIRIISMPCMEKFYEQSDGYKNDLFPNNAKVFVIEYASSFGWEKFVTSSEYLFTIDKFGVSSSKDDVVKYCNVDIDTIIEKIKSLI